MSGYFQGYYYKHQKDGNTICFIVGRTKRDDFIQVITNEKVYHYPSHDGIKVTKKGIWVDLSDVKGVISYGKLSPLKSHIMGPFRYLPMQCSHSVSSMEHPLKGSFLIEGTPVDFTGGKGYVEGDKGRSFPCNYMWLHCNDFKVPLSIMASVADIPFMGIHFMGCICAILYQGKEYRLATYRGVKIQEANQGALVLTQGSYRLEVWVKPDAFHPLKSPVSGKMKGMIHESNCSDIHVRFFSKGKMLFDENSSNASFECNL